LRVVSGPNSGRAEQSEAQLRHPEFEHHRQSQLVEGAAVDRRHWLPCRLGPHLPSTRPHHGQDYRADESPAQGLCRSAFTLMIFAIRDLLGVCSIHRPLVLLSANFILLKICYNLSGSKAQVACNINVFRN